MVKIKISLASNKVFFVDELEDETNSEGSHPYQELGRRPLIFNEKPQQPQLGPGRGHQLQSGLLDKGPNSHNQPHFSSLPIGSPNPGPNNLNQPYHRRPIIGLQNTGPNYIIQPNLNRLPIGLKNTGPNRVNQPHLSSPPIGLQNTVPRLGRPVRLAGNSPVRVRKRNSGGFLGLGKIKLRF